MMSYLTDAFFTKDLFFSVTMVQTIIVMLTWKFRETLTNSIHLAVARDIVRGKREVFGG